MVEATAPSAKNRANLLVCLVFLGSLSLLLVGLKKRGFLEFGSDLGFARQVEECTLEGVEPFHLRQGRWHFVVISSLEADGSLLNYLERLLAAPHLNTGNLMPLVLIDGVDEAANIRAFVQANGLSYTVMPLHDVDASALVNLGIKDHRRRYFLLDPALRVAFYAEFMRPKDLRQLLEKHFSVPSVSLVADRPLNPGSTLAFSSLRSIWSDQSEFDARSGLLIVFTSICVSCSLDNKVEELEIHQETLKTVAELEGLKLSLIFSPAFVARDVMYRLEAINVDVPGFVAGHLTGIEDAYSRQPLHGWDVMVLKTDEDSRVTQLQSWSDFLDNSLSS